MLSFASESSRSNPWAPDERHPYDEFLSRARLSGHHQLLPENEVEARYNDTAISYGIQTISQANEVDDLLSKTRLRIAELKLENKNAGILRSEELRVKLDGVKLLLNEFETCVNEAAKLQKTLRQPFQINYMKIEKKYHEDVTKLFSNAVKMLSRLQEEINTLEWHGTNTVAGPPLKRVNELLSKSVMELQSGLQKVNETKSCLAHDRTFSHGSVLNDTDPNL